MNFTKDDKRCVNPNKTLGIDQACLSIINDQNASTKVFSYVNECWACNGSLIANLSSQSNTTIVVPTRYEMHMYYTINDLQFCHGAYKFREGGHYGWNLTDRSCSSYYTIQEPSFFNSDTLVIGYSIFLIALLVAYISLKFLRLKWERLRNRIPDDPMSDTAVLHQPEITPPPSPPPIVNISRSSTRIHSIDTFRGIAVMLMIFVNNGGGQYVYFNHSPWYGLTVADLVLPWFAWIMGLTLVVSLRTQLRISVSRQRIIFRSLRRTAFLILFGLIINSNEKTTLADLRYSGVLQLLGITYLICSIIEAVFMKAQRNFQYGRFMFLQDILDCWPQWLIIIGLTTTHTLITFLLRVPGCPTGYLGPGGYDRYGKYVNCTGGAAGYIDRLVLGNHGYNKTENEIYGTTLRHDPEGIMNTLSAVLFVALGVQAGRILLCYYLHLHSKMIRWFSWAVITGIVAGFLCNWEKEGGIIPVSKNMMTISFVLATSSFAFILFAILFYLIDHKRVWNGAPFVYSGANPIFLYVGHYILMKRFPWYVKLDHPTHLDLLTLNDWTTTLWMLIAYGLHKKNIILTI